MRKICARSIVVTFVVFVVFVSSIVYSHCQIPCGIYDDQMRIKMIAENITTIEKSIIQIDSLSRQKSIDLNQINRWIDNKEKHADDTSNIISYYFLAQRIKPAEKADSDSYREYVKKLTLLHEMLLYCVKAKQTVDITNVETLRGLLGDFEDAYFENMN